MDTSLHLLRGRIAFLGLATALLTGVVFLTGAARPVDSTGHDNLRLGGAWIGCNVAGNLWQAVQAPLDPAGRTAGLRINLLVSDPAFGGLLTLMQADTLTDGVGEIRMVEPGKSRYTFVAYLMQQQVNPPVRRAISVLSGVGEFTSANAMETTYTTSVYTVDVPGYPNSDADGDGFPDPGSIPLVTIPGFDTAKRVLIR